MAVDPGDSVRLSVEVDTSQMVQSSEDGARAAAALREQLAAQQAKAKELQISLRNLAGGGEAFAATQREQKVQLQAVKTAIASTQQALHQHSQAEQEALERARMLAAAEAQHRLDEEAGKKRAEEAAAAEAERQKKQEAALKHLDEAQRKHDAERKKQEALEAKSARDAQERIRKTGAAVDMAVGPMGGLSARGQELAKSIGDFGVAGAFLLASKYARQFISSIASAAKSMTEFAVAAADARRSQTMMLEGMTSVPNWFGRAKESGDALQATIGRVYDQVAVGRDEIVKYSQELYSMGFRGARLENTLLGVGMAAATGSSEAVEYAKRMAPVFGSADRYLQQMRARFGDLNGKALLALPIQMDRARKSLAGIFAGLNVEPILRGIRSVLSLLDQTTISGKAVKLLLTTAFGPIFEHGEGAGLIIRRLFQGGIIAALRFALTLGKMRNTLKEVFAGTEFLRNLRMASGALAVGKILGGLLIDTLIALAGVAVTTGAVMAFALSPLIAALGIVRKALHMVVDLFRFLAKNSSTVFSVARLMLGMPEPPKTTEGSTPVSAAPSVGYSFAAPTASFLPGPLSREGVENGRHESTSIPADLFSRAMRALEIRGNERSSASADDHSRKQSVEIRELNVTVGSAELASGVGQSVRESLIHELSKGQLQYGA